MNAVPMCADASVASEASATPAPPRVIDRTITISAPMRKRDRCLEKRGVKERENLRRGVTSRDEEAGMNRRQTRSQLNTYHNQGGGPG
jgi:hypothetical protein